MTKKEAIEWLYLHSKSEPYEAMFEGSDTSYWHCCGCEGEFVSRWPNWEKPTLNNFPHKNNCKYLLVLKLLKLNEQARANLPSNMG